MFRPAWSLVSTPCIRRIPLEISHSPALFSRAPIGLSQTSTRTLWRAVNAQADVQPVRFRKRPTLAKTLFRAFIIGSAAWYLKWLLFDLFGISGVQSGAVRGENDEEEEEQDQTDQSEEEDYEVVEFEADENAWVVPLTLPKPLPQEFYKGSDPEWKEFQKLAPDRARLAKIYHSLAEAIFNSVKKNPRLGPLMGKDSRIKKVWLDVNFPDGPPADYAFTGLEWGQVEGIGYYVSTVEARLSADEYERMSRIMWPLGTLRSVYSYCHAHWTMQWQKWKADLGLDTTLEPNSTAFRVDRLLKIVRANQLARNAKLHPDSSAGASAGGDSHPTGVAQAEGRNRGETTVDGPITKLLVPDVRLDAETPEKLTASLVFADAMAKNNNKTRRREPPRGNVTILGMMSTEGQRASLLLHVLAFYDPKVSTFTRVVVAVVSVTPWKQAPKG